MSPWLLGAGLLFNLFGQHQAQGQQNQANALAARQVAMQEKIANRYLGRAERLYDPIEEEALGRLVDRMRTSPFYAPQWLAQAQRLRKPMTLSYA